MQTTTASERRREARGEPGGADAHAGEHEAERQHPARLAEVAARAEERLAGAVGDVGDERERADGRQRVVALGDQEGEQGEQGAGGEVHAGVAEDQHRQRARPVRGGLSHGATADSSRPASSSATLAAARCRMGSSRSVTRAATSAKPQPMKNGTW